MKIILLVFVAVIALAQSAGIKQLRPSMRISNGDNVEIVNQASFAHQVLFNPTYDDGTVGLCAGILVSSRHVLTAAHCIKGEHLIQGRMVRYDTIEGTLYFGILNKGDRFREDTVSRNVFPADFSIHIGWETIPEYNHDDMALIRLPQPVVPVPNRIAVIPLPTQNVCNTNLQGTSVVISGWGRMEDERLPNILQYGNVIIQNCENHGLSNNNFVCVAGLRNEYSCLGDSGGPMIYTDAQARRYVIGVTSFGRGPCSAKTLSAYSRVCLYTQWINRIIANVPARPQFGW